MPGLLEAAPGFALSANYTIGRRQMTDRDTAIPWEEKGDATFRWLRSLPLAIDDDAAKFGAKLYRKMAEPLEMGKAKKRKAKKRKKKGKR